MPRGAVRTKILNLSKNIHSKKCIVLIKNSDTLCCARAIIFGLNYLSNNVLGTSLKEYQIKELRNGFRKIQATLAQKLCSMCGAYTENGFTLKNIRNVESSLNIQITVVCPENFDSVI